MHFKVDVHVKSCRSSEDTSKYFRVWKNKEPLLVFDPVTALIFGGIFGIWSNFRWHFRNKEQLSGGQKKFPFDQKKKNSRDLGTAE